MGIEFYYDILVFLLEDLLLSTLSVIQDKAIIGITRDKTEELGIYFWLIEIEIEIFEISLKNVISRINKQHGLSILCHSDSFAYKTSV